VSVFVNPGQFAPTEDFAAYPRDLPGDVGKLAAVGVDAVFAPTVEEMYPAGFATTISMRGPAEGLETDFRPHFFAGVATVVAKLFVLAGPCLAVFGRKDYQQLKIIERLAQDLLFDIAIVAHPTVRDPDGLALSSRNQKLSEKEREQALAIPVGLSLAAQRFSEGERASSALLDPVRTLLSRAGLRVDYVTLADPERLTPIEAEAQVAERALLAVAAFAGSTRLIDSVVLGEDAAPFSGSALADSLAKPALSKAGAG
jgi:pantoate--beta-alanine ligase